MLDRFGQLLDLLPSPRVYLIALSGISQASLPHHRFPSEASGFDEAVSLFDHDTPPGPSPWLSGTCGE